MPRVEPANAGLVLIAFVATLMGACSTAPPFGTSGNSEATSPKSSEPPTPTSRPNTVSGDPMPTPTRAASCPTYEAAAPAASAVVTLGPSGTLPISPVPGERFILEGIVLSWTCDVRSNTLVSAWQTDAAGHYGPATTDDSLICCYYQGTVDTDGHGRFALATVRPGTDPAPDGELPAHIHLALGTIASSGPDMALVFGDDPAIDRPSNPRQMLIDMERRTDASGEYWYAFVQLRL
jgi:protocatechuate 3,4-dioxygenase beta subunit